MTDHINVERSERTEHLSYKNERIRREKSALCVHILSTDCLLCDEHRQNAASSAWRKSQSHETDPGSAREIPPCFVFC